MARVRYIGGGKEYRGPLGVFPKDEDVKVDEEQAQSIARHGGSDFEIDGAPAAPVVETASEGVRVKPAAVKKK